MHSIFGNKVNQHTLDFVLITMIVVKSIPVYLKLIA